MALKVAVQMDHISTVNIAGDTTFALSLEAQKRGHELYHYTPDRLSMRDGVVSARLDLLQRLQLGADALELADCRLDVGIAQGALAIDDEDSALIRQRAALDGDTISLHRPVPEVAQ